MCKYVVIIIFIFVWQVQLIVTLYYLVYYNIYLCLSPTLVGLCQCPSAIIKNRNNIIQTPACKITQRGFQTNAWGNGPIWDGREDIVATFPPLIVSPHSAGSCLNIRQ